MRNLWLSRRGLLVVTPCSFVVWYQPSSSSRSRQHGSSNRWHCYHNATRCHNPEYIDVKDTLNIKMRIKTEKSLGTSLTRRISKLYKFRAGRGADNTTRNKNGFGITRSKDLWDSVLQVIVQVALNNRIRENRNMANSM